MPSRHPRASIAIAAFSVFAIIATATISAPAMAAPPPDKGKPSPSATPTPSATESEAPAPSDTPAPSDNPAPIETTVPTTPSSEPTQPTAPATDPPASNAPQTESSTLSGTSTRGKGKPTPTPLHRHRHRHRHRPRPRRATPTSWRRPVTRSRSPTTLRATGRSRSTAGRPARRRPSTPCCSDCRSPRAATIKGVNVAQVGAKSAVWRGQVDLRDHGASRLPDRRDRRQRRVHADRGRHDARRRLPGADQRRAHEVPRGQGRQQDLRGQHPEPL